MMRVGELARGRRSDSMQYLAAHCTAANAGIVDLSVGQVRAAKEMWLTVDPLAVVGTQDYGRPRGEPELIASYLHMFAQSTDLTEQNVVVTPGSKFALWLAISILTKPGSRVLVPVPGWAPYRIWLSSRGAKVVPYAPTSDGYAFAAAMLTDGGANAIIINSPNNPTGLEVSEVCLDSVVEAATRKSAPIIADETYRSFGDNDSSMLRYVGLLDTPVVVADSLSKMLGWAGLRVGFLVSNSVLVEEALDFISMTLSGVSRPSQLAATVLLSDRFAEFRRSIIGLASTSRRFLVENLRAVNLEPESSGALYVWIRRGRGATESTIELPQATLLGVTGELFGAAGYVRLCATAVPLSDLRCRLGRNE